MNVFNGFFQSVCDWFSFAAVQFKMLTLVDVIDIFLLTVVLFVSVEFIRERRAGKLLVGVASVVVLYGVSVFCHLNALSYLIKAILEVGIVAIIVIFQTEIRAALEKIGDGPFRGIKHFESKNTTQLTAEISALCDAIGDMSRSHTGALIVIERTTKLGDIMETGVMVDAVLSSKLLKNIFYDKAPLHDGAVIMRHMRISAAGCVLPNAVRDPDEVANVGTRHRAALGVSEISDAVVIVVSEETGKISLALNGKLHRDYGVRPLRHDLLVLLGGKNAVESENAKKN